MRNAHALIGLLGALVLASACGNLSNEDLLFLAAIPKADEVALDVEAPAATAAVAQAVVGQQAVIYRDAAATAAGINHGVDQMLTFVDNLGRGYPPTKRTADSRIWGPVENIDGKGITLRVVISRGPRPDGADGPRYTFCVQMGRDADITGAAPACGTYEGGGYFEVLGGYYDPDGAQGGARSGEGALRLDFGHLLSLGATADPVAGVFWLDYRFVTGGAEKQIAVTWEDPPFSSDLTLGDLSYTYGRSPDGMVSYDFAVQADLVGGGLTNPFSDLLETLRVQATWQEGGPGLGNVTIEGGDVPSGSVATVTECWDSAALRTYWRFEAPFDATQNREEGDPLDCPSF